MAHVDPAPPRLTFVMTIDVRVDSPVDIGAVPGGRRRIVPIRGGTFAGPDLRGTVPDGGADWQIVREDGQSELEARYTLRTDRGDLIYVRNTGLRHAPPAVTARLLAGEPVDPSLVYFRTVPVFETAAAGLHWLTRAIFIGDGERHPDHVVIRVWRIE
ncbi:MAG TPA: DUF3237 domain-containing protein [Vicinamibacterales bacterium]|jgi:hypothetical protein